MQSKFLIPLGLVFSAACAWGMARPPSPALGTPPVALSTLSVQGKIEGENVSFSLNFQADVAERGSRFTLVEGAVSCQTSSLPRGVILQREGAAYVLVFEQRGRQAIQIEFASRAAREGDWRSTQFVIPNATVRRLAMIGDRKDLEIEFPGALGVERKLNAAGQLEVHANLGPGRTFAVRWKPEVKALTGELAVTCDANTIASASVGVLRLDSLFTYRVVQGALNQLALGVPDDLNITQVRGADIRSWSVENAKAGGRQLVVVLNRPQERIYALHVESERVLPEFPCAFALPVLTPANTIRTSGFLLVGTDSAVKLLVAKSAGLTQVDQAAFPAAPAVDGQPRSRPARSAYAYQYANMPYRLELSADDIVTAFHGEERLVLALADNDLTLEASVELDVRDAPAREVTIATDPGWSVVNVSGGNVADYDVRDQGGARQIHVYFREAVQGRTLFDLRMEKPLAEGKTEFQAPAFKVLEARSERGYLVLRAEKGLRLKAQQSTGLNEVHTGSIPLRVADAQQAFRFKSGEWTLAVRLDKTIPSMYAELFQLVTMGESALYGSCSITYHIGGAPVRTLKVRVPAACQNVEFTGRDLRGFEKTNNEWQVTFQEKILGDYTLLVTYDQPFAFEGGEVPIGGIETINAETESGYLVLAGAASLYFAGAPQLDASLMELDSSEIPQEYALLINDPILRAFKYVGTPHQATLAVKRYPTQPLLTQVADHTSLSTRLSQEGEAVTTVQYDIKNSSQQYLGITLPPQAKLWSARVEGAAVQALAVPKEANKILVPLRRLRDPNQVLRVELVYAETRSPLGKVWPRRMAFQAPTTAAQMVFSKWSVTVPEKFALASIGGNMAPEQAAEPLGFTASLLALAGSYGQLIAGAPLWPVFFLVLLVAACALVYRCTARLATGWAWIIAGLAVALAGLLALMASHGHPLSRFLLPADLMARPLLQTVFSRPVSLLGSPPALDVSVAPAWIGSSGSLLTLIAGLALGAFLVRDAFRRRPAKPTSLVLGLCAAVWGLAATACTSPWLQLALRLGLPLLLAVGLIRLAWRCGCRRRENQPAPVAAEPETTSLPGGEDFAAPTLPPTPDAPESGYIRLSALLPLAALAAGLILRASAASTPPPATPAPPAPPVMKSVVLQIDGPGMEKRNERMARVTATLEFHADQAQSFLLLPPPFVLTDYRLKHPGLSLRTEVRGCILSLESGGDYRVEFTYLAPVSETAGVWRLAFLLPPNLRNQVSLRLPAVNLDVRSDVAVWLKTAEQKSNTVAQAMFGPEAMGELAWQPRERKTGLEKAVVFCEVNTLAVFEAGVVNLHHAIHYQIPQGEVQSLNLRIPAEMSVTSVSAPNLSTWRFDPDQRLLEALLEKPVSGDFTLRLVTQLPQENLPYDATLAMPVIEQANRQRGAIALAATEAVQIRADTVAGLNAMNIGDFSAELRALSAAGGAANLKRAFRYHQLPASLKAHVERVVTELRVVEDARLDVSDERIALSSKLNIAVAKSGVFAVRLGLPAGYDIEALTCPDMSHWDELKDGGHGVLVHFDKQILGSRTINLVCSRTGKGVESAITAPRITVDGALKHTGTLAVSGERGVRFLTTAREGVSEINPSELGIAQPGYLAFRLLRPDWTVQLKTEVLAPVVRADVLQRVDVVEGFLRVRAYVSYKVDNAGVKVFTLQAPRPGVALTVTGRNMVRVQETDKAKGLWLVELHNKVENDYALEVSYQIPYDPKAPTVDIQPLVAVGADAQKGYLAVMSSARLKVNPQTIPAGFKEEDARGIPAQFNAGDLSDAILCYRVTRPDLVLPLRIVRHGSADVLPATVQKVRLQSAVSEDFHIVTRVQMDMTVGDLRFLKATLPAESEIWALFVNGRSVPPLKEGATCLVPLDRASARGATSVEFIYSNHSRDGFLSRAHRFEGPKFDLPLSDVEWTLYVPPQLHYFGFDGTMKYRQPTAEPMVQVFDDKAYLANNSFEVQSNIQRAESVLRQGEQLARQGYQQEAKQAFESALYLSQGKADFNEDVRLQYRNLAKQQAIVGLVNRRGNLKVERNIADEAQLRQLKGFKGGNWTYDYGNQVAQSLNAKDTESLNVMAEKILDQQAAAAGIVYPIRITVPLQGRALEFYRQLQVKPSADLVVSFKAYGDRLWRWVAALAALVGLFVVLRLLLGLALTPARSAAR